MMEVMMRTVVTITILYSIDESAVISWLNVILGDQNYYFCRYF